MAAQDSGLHATSLRAVRAQRLTRARQPRLDRADRDAERKGDFLVAEAVDLPQDDRRPLIERQVIERLLQLRGQLLLREHAVGRFLPARWKVAVRGNVLFERHLIGAVTPAPETVPVPRLVDGDAVDPGPQARLTTEPVNGPEDPEEHFLRQVERFVAIAEQVHRQLNDHSLVFADQLGAGRLVARRTPLHEGGLPAVDVGPTRDARLLHGGFHYNKIDPDLPESSLSQRTQPSRW